MVLVLSCSLELFSCPLNLQLRAVGTGHTALSVSGFSHVLLTATAAAVQDGDPRVLSAPWIAPTCSTCDKGKYAKKHLGEAFIGIILNTSV